MSLLVLCIIIIVAVCYYILDLQTLCVGEFLEEYNNRILALSNAAVLAYWTHTTNVTQLHSELSDEAEVLEASYKAEAYRTAKRFLESQRKGDLHLSYDEKRQLKKVGEASLVGSEREELSAVMNNISTTYALAEVCLQDKDLEEVCLKLHPGLESLMGANRSYSLLQEVWETWRDNVGSQVRPHVSSLVFLKNKMAILNGYPDYGAQLRGKYETDGFEDEIKMLNDQLAPLYRLVHAYVRLKLQHEYGKEVIPDGGMIPACVLGDMWGRFWTDLYDIVEPFPEMQSVDPTSQMKKKNMTVREMYEIADRFYRSMGLKPIPDDFFEKSMLVRPTDGRDVVCHGTAWDFMDGKDFRIRMCTEVNFKSLEVVHHELGHIQYFMQYAHLPQVYRDGANDGFHEAVGELMGMTMATVNHLTSLDLLPPTPTADENTINFLLRTALKTVVSLPFHYVNDLWRWELFRGEIAEDRWNARYWQLKEIYLGVKPPSERTEEHLDIFNIFHVNNDFDMIRYFTRTILQFQFAEALCDTSGYDGPLHDCDFSHSTEAGDKLAAMLSLGSSRPWKDALEQLAGTRDMDARPILRYFEPLREWLEKYLQEHNQVAGWLAAD